MLICCTQLNFGSEIKLAANNSILEANPKFDAEDTIQQRMLIRCTQLNFGSELQIRCRTNNSEANVYSLQTTQFRQ
jgi:hypothetical protein